MECIFCNEEVPIKGKVKRKSICPHCNRDLRCCKQCKFYNSDAYNECREVLAERIIEKERSNFCDYFATRGSKTGGSSFSRSKEAKMALENLFKKK